LRLWDLIGLSGRAPVQLRRERAAYYNTAFSPGGRWFIGAAYPGRSEATFWPIARRLPIVLEGWFSSGFTSNGRYFVAIDYKSPNEPDTRVRLWPVPGNTQDNTVDLMFPPGSGRIGHQVMVDPAVRHVLALAYGRSSYLFSTADGEARNLFGFPASDNVYAGDFSPSGRLVAAATLVGEGTPTLRVWDLETDQVRVYEQPVDPDAWQGYRAIDLQFIDENTLYTAGGNGLLRWDLKTETWERLAKAPSGDALGMQMTADRRMALIFGWTSGWVRTADPVELRDLKTGTVRTLEIPGEGWLGLSPDGSIWASGEPDGTVMVGRINGGEPHLLFGHEGAIGSTSISPDSRWIVTTSNGDHTLRLWPMPDLSKPPLHTLPHDELIAKLHSLTNLRAVRDDESSTGWKIEVGPFPGWAEVPEW
jgi:WD40 repeat protein